MENWILSLFPRNLLEHVCISNEIAEKLFITSTSIFKLFPRQELTIASETCSSLMSGLNGPFTFPVAKMLRLKDLEFQIESHFSLGKITRYF